MRKNKKYILDEGKIANQFKEMLHKMRITNETPDVSDYFEQRYKNYYVQVNMKDNLVELIFIHKKTNEHYNIILEIK